MTRNIAPWQAPRTAPLLPTIPEFIVSINGGAANHDTASGTFTYEWDNSLSIGGDIQVTAVNVSDPSGLYSYSASVPFTAGFNNFDTRGVAVTEIATGLAPAVGTLIADVTIELIANQAASPNDIRTFETATAYVG